jgi:type I restriction-modification system DNA methylase subunit
LNTKIGQFFTPYDVSRMNARMSLQEGDAYSNITDQVVAAARFCLQFQPAISRCASAIAQSPS